MNSDDDSQQHLNRLANESSPYLLQHARNPVDWYPWGEEAFARARSEDKPIFLSVGYSACHWCHVMEHESFENKEIARLLNENYICIKVDREERPDIDQLYMAAVQLITRRGGWPMSVFLTPEGQPFYGGTYWPPTSRMGMPGFREILIQLTAYWKNRRDDVTKHATDLVAAIRQITAPNYRQAELNEQTLRAAMRQMINAADRVHGGFGGAPKFPHAMDIRFLLRCWKRFGDEQALAIVRLTLDKMAAGGIYDHLGGGFHRYATDEKWLVPHFEKMLYDNALLIPAYVEAWQATGAETYLVPVRETLEYVLREMTQPEGGFYATQDADSEGVEGKFFVWTDEEIAEALDPRSARIFRAAYDVTPQGNWEGKTILHRPHDDTRIAQSLGISVEELRDSLAHSRRILFQLRSERTAPARDEKILVAWNGLMISAIARAVCCQAASVESLDAVLHQALDAAVRSARFLLPNTKDKQGRLLHSYKDGTARFHAYLDDYACLIDGLVELYQATFTPHWLEEALVLADQMIQDFSDTSTGMFFYTPKGSEELIARPKDSQDHATPSGNSMAATALLKLGRLTGQSEIEEAGYNVLLAMSGLLNEAPLAAAQGLIALDFQLGPTHEIALIDGSDSSQGKEMLSVLRKEFIPNILLAWRPCGISDDDLPGVLRALLEGRESPTGQVIAYVCQQGQCQLPVEKVDQLMQRLQQP